MKRIVKLRENEGLVAFVLTISIFILIAMIKSQTHIQSKKDFLNKSEFGVNTILK